MVQRTHPIWDGATLELVVLGSRRKQTEQARKNELITVPPRLLLQDLPPGSCREFLPLLLYRMVNWKAACTLTTEPHLHPVHHCLLKNSPHAKALGPLSPITFPFAMV